MTEIVNVDECGPTLIAVVSDGAGSARFSTVGARLICEHMVDSAIEFLCAGKHLAALNTRTMHSWLRGYRLRMSNLADRFGVEIDDFACTLLVAILGERHSAFAQVGDGAIVVGPNDEPDHLLWVYWPQQGEYENVTYFATSQDAAAQLQFDLVPHPVDELAMFTDGVQRFALHYQTRTVHKPFLLPKLGALRSESPGHSERLSEALTRYLDSEPVNSRTDDDKTMVLASRREPISRHQPGVNGDGNKHSYSCNR